MVSIDNRPPPAGGNYRQQWIYMLWQKYGLTVKQFNQMVLDQHNRCAICNEVFTKTPHVDHDHETGIVRKLLCGKCNTGLGMFGDSIRSLANAIVYLEDHGKSY